MKKIYLIIVLIFIPILWLSQKPTETYSSSDLPYSKPNSCSQKIENEMFIMNAGWTANLNAIINQEKPTSQKVDEAYESLNTYKCWLNYLCEAVIYSGNADEKGLKNNQLTKENIPTIPGCLPIQELEIPNTQIQFMPLCKEEDDSNTKLANIQANFEGCQQLLQFQFYNIDQANPKATDSTQQVQQRSGAFITLERTLKTASANQKGRLLANKIRDITLKMQGMESNMTLLREALNKFDSLIPCVIDQCSQ